MFAGQTEVLSYSRYEIVVALRSSSRDRGELVDLSLGFVLCCHFNISTRHGYTGVGGSSCIGLVCPSV